MDLGLTGVSVSSNPIVSLLNSGLSFATPIRFGERASPGAGFKLELDRYEEWKNWISNIRLPERIIVQQGENHEVRTWCRLPRKALCPKINKAADQDLPRENHIDEVRGALMAGIYSRPCTISMLEPSKSSPTGCTRPPRQVPKKVSAMA